MKTRSAKAKGRKVQNWLHDELHSLFPELEPDDIIPRQMGGSGEDIMLSPAARKLIPCAFECKNVEKLSLHAAMRQAEANANGLIPVVIFKKNYSPYGAVINNLDLDKLCLFLGQEYELCTLTAISLNTSMLKLKNLNWKKLYYDLLHNPHIVNIVRVNHEAAYIMPAINFLDIIKNADKDLKARIATAARRA